MRTRIKGRNQDGDSPPGGAMGGPGSPLAPTGPGRRRRLTKNPLALAAVLLALAVAGCKTDLYTKLSEREANEMVALLMKHGIDAGRVVAKDGTSTIQVDDKRFTDAIDLLKASGFPRQTFANMGEVFKSTGLIASPTEEKARFIFALSEELSRTISDIDGVLSARIHVVLPKNDLLKQDTTPSSASVFIRHDTRAPLKALLPQIKMLVANSIEGLSYEKVSVVLVPVDRTAAEAADGAAYGAAPRVPAAVRPGSAASLEMLAGMFALMGIAGGVYWYTQRRSAAGDEAEAPEPDSGADPESVGRNKGPAALRRVA